MWGFWRSIRHGRKRSTSLLPTCSSRAPTWYPRHHALRDVEEVDGDGVRIAAGKNTAYDLHLSRTLRRATLVHAPSSQAAIELFLAGGADVVAGVRQPLAAVAARRPGYRVMPGRFLAIEQAMTLPRGRSAGAAYLRAFIEEMKASGFVAAALAGSGQNDATVAPKQTV